jgi:hypothetical protein
MSKANAFIQLYEETSLDQLLSQNPEIPKRDFHFNLGTILDHVHDFNIITQKVDDFATMKHCTDPWLYIVARLNAEDYIENAKIAVEGGKVRVSNNKVDAGFDRDGLLSQVYTNKDKVKSDDDARLEDVYIKGCSKQLYTLLQSTFK